MQLYYIKKIILLFLFALDSMDTWKTEINLNNPSSVFATSGILKSHLGSSYTGNRNKTLFLLAPTGYSILAAIRLLDLRPYNQDSLTVGTLYFWKKINKNKYSENLRNELTEIRSFVSDTLLESAPIFILRHTLLEFHSFSILQNTVVVVIRILLVPY